MGSAHSVTARIELDLEPPTRPIRGTITDQSGGLVAFAGWLELIQMIEEIRRRGLPACARRRGSTE